MDPLLSRSLPNGLWKKVPPSWVQWDIQTQEKLSTILPLGQSPWKELKWLSENTAGLFVSMLTLMLLSMLWFYKKEKRLFPKILTIRVALYFFIFLGLSDLVSSGIKTLIGRFKPHVNFYNPTSIFNAALSMPSNHAFNISFILTFLYLALSKSKSQNWRAPYSVLLCLGLLVSISRIFFGQHYPLDILLGWLLGASFGYFSYLLTLKLTASKMKTK